MPKIRVTFFLITLIVSFTLSGQENNYLLCADGIDNDNDGFVDCEDQECVDLPNQGCAICTDGLSFADYTIDYESGCTISDPDLDGALGVSDYMGSSTDAPDFIYLGEGGFIKLGFDDNLISNSGDNQADVFVFEVGTLVEPMSISLRPFDNKTTDKLIALGYADPDLDGFYYMIDLGGSTSFVDIDELVPGCFSGELVFDAIEIRDIDDRPCMGGAPGADIDAVCALYSLDCAGTPNGTFIFDACGECLAPTDPTFNQSCIDCTGTPNGDAIIDDCGECLEPLDPNFNQSCIDCAGTFNGTAIIDVCGLCLEPTDPAFNQSCLDCAGTPNGTAVVDECGECHEPSSLLYNESCLDCAGIPNGISVIDSCGVCLEALDPTFNQSCFTCDLFFPNIFIANEDKIHNHFRVLTCPDYNPLVTLFEIYDRYGTLIYHKENLLLKDEACKWNGKLDGTTAESGVYIYLLQISMPSGQFKVYTGDVTLLW